MGAFATGLGGWRVPAAGSVAAAMLIWAIYAVIFFITGPVGLSEAALAAAVNVLPLVCLAVAVQFLLRRMTSGHSLRRWALVHAGLACAFSVLWYAAVVLGLAVVRGFQTGEFQVQGFSGPALSWQLFQGLCLYAVVAALSHSMQRASSTMPPAIAHKTQHYLVKADEGLVPVRVEDIVCLEGAHDYVQLTTRATSHLVRHGLADFAAKLDPACFVRIHRSAMVNLDHVQRVETVGAGRLRVVLANGRTLSSSRAGAQRLRLMVI